MNIWKKKGYGQYFTAKTDYETYPPVLFDNLT